MSTATTTSAPPPVKKGQKVKFVVTSAEEAVNLIRQEMGPDAKVLSVRQVEGKGLAKFLTAPKLEVIAVVPESEKTELKNTASLSAEEKILLEESSSTQAPYAPGANHSTLPSQIKNNRPSADSSQKLENVLRAAGFEASVIRRFEGSTDWEKLQRVPVKTALSDLARRLRLDYDAIEIPPVTKTIAFVGPTAVGKTTALCKQLAHEVFFERRAVQVMKLDGGTPNADTALGLYCEVMGVPLIRDAQQVEPTSALLIDTSGINLSDQDEVTALKKKLDSLGVQTRVWVINAAYENSLIDRGLAVAEELGATHSVYTHLDELATSSRLWHFVLSGRMPALFGSNGPGVAHDRIASLGGLLLQKTFPEYLLK